MKKLKISMLLFLFVFLLASCEEALEKPLEMPTPSTVPTFSVPENKPKEEEKPSETPSLDTNVLIAPTEEKKEEKPEERAENEPVVVEEEKEEPPTIEDTAKETPSENIGKLTINTSENDGYPITSFGSPYLDNGKLTNEKMGWYFNKNTTNEPPTAQSKFDVRLFDGYYLGNVSEKEVYLTFDEGYENGYTEKILDVLKEKNTPAAFFVTKSYITSQPDLIMRMVNEGHIVGNHTVKHLSCPDLSDDEMVKELVDTAAAFKELTGLDIPPYFRPPMGEYSARTLKITQDTGYKSIFWSFAYKDWEVNNQPGKATAYNTVIKGAHNGGILLLHAVSSSNTEALGDIIDSYIESGYTFKTLYDLPEYNN